MEIISANVTRTIAQHAMLPRYFLQLNARLALLSIDESNSSPVLMSTRQLDLVELSFFDQLAEELGKLGKLEIEKNWKLESLGKLETEEIGNWRN